jgi:hypothetical protein
MARLLRDTDYLRNIQDAHLQQIIESDPSIQLDVEQSAQSEITSYLAQRYLPNKIFTDTTEFNIGTTYYGKNLVEYTEPEWVVSTTYALNDRVSYLGKIYKNILSCTGIKPTFVTNWEFICYDKDLYYAKTNNPEWSYLTTYSMGDIVWYENIYYTALSGSTGVLPTDTGYWSGGSTLSFVGQYPENTTYWIKGDNRNQQIVMYLIDITLYHLHCRINPRNVPEMRAIRYDGANALQTGGAIGWLKKVASGDVTAELPVIVPVQGSSIRYGSVQKNINNY